MKYLVTFSYDGSAFVGFQRQKKLKTVQGEIETALTKINNNEKVELVASGRTDRGVHALNQKAHFKLNKRIPIYNLKRALNSCLNGEIYIIDISFCDDDFHARYSVKSKKYKYIINVGNYNPIERSYVYQYNKPLDVDLMKKALKLIEGTHDFRSFCTDEKERENCIRTIFETDIVRDSNKIIISIKGNGFLRHMVRNIVGVLVEIGAKKISGEEIISILNDKTRIKAKKSVPGCGLYLVEVNYE